MDMDMDMVMNDDITINLSDENKGKIQPYIEWTTEHENILVDWADKAICYRWLHSKSHNDYSRLNTMFTIPVIIMSTLTGTANFAQDRIPADFVGIYTMIVGAINLLAGILTTIQQFLKISELNEAHRVSSISWSKFSRNIKVELSKSPQERTPVIQMLKHSKEEFDRLIETSPTVSNKVIKLFIGTFSGGEIKVNHDGDPIHLNPKQRAFSELNKPEICDSIEPMYKSVYKPRVEVNSGPVDLSKITKVLLNNKNKKLVEDFIVSFELEKKREPTTEEIVDNLDNIIPSNIIQKVILDVQKAKLENESINDSMV